MVNPIQSIRIYVSLFTGPFISIRNCPSIQPGFVRDGFALEIPLSKD